MKAIRIHQTGDVDVLVTDEIPQPQMGEGEICLKVRSSSLNHMDLWVRKGLPGMASLPMIMGCDASGDVVSVGKNVIDWQVGDRAVLMPLVGCQNCQPCREGRVNYCRNFKIYGEHINGTQCEYIVVSSRQLLKLDDRISYEVGSAFPLASMTAWHMVQKLELQTGDFVLVIGATSGVSASAIQLAKLQGALVITTVTHSHKMKFAFECGADFIIDLSQQNLAQEIKNITKGQGVKGVIEHAGQAVWGDVLKSLAWGGTLVTCGATTGPTVSLDLRHVFIKQQRIIGSTMGNWQDLVTVHKMIAEGKLKIPVSHVFSFRDIKDAHRALEKGGQMGKVVLTGGF